MSDQGEKTCPLCAEEMDLTDQQLRPCKCGYEICVWCWHHIMDMAEKDNTEGRCPACRTPYNKEKIVGTASKCERLVTGMSVEKKQKPQKGKTKTSEGRKQLGTVRVIQRNLVYIVGLPLNLADEDLLQQKEYFGRYGKVLKVSISRTAAGAIQQFANSTCSVYITYSKEEEAVRSIQSAHGFVLEGRTLRACFGTTKYCHAWLRNAPCTNADCLYLHEFGPEEDSFTKDEIVSAYTRNRVQQITGVTNDMQRRSGNLLPPPADDYSYSTTNCAWPKPLSKTTTTINNPANGIKVPVPNGKSTALPAAASWGTRASNSQPSFKESDGSTPALSFSSAVVSPSSQHNEELEEEEKGSFGNSLSIKQDLDKNTSTDKSSTDTSHNYSNPVSDEDEEEEEEEEEEEVINNLCIDMSSSSINNNNQRLQPCYESDPLTSNESENTSKQSDLVSNVQNKAAINEAEQDMLSFNDERLRDTQVLHNNNMGDYPLHAHVSSHNTPHVVDDYSSSFREVSSNGNTQGSKRENGGIDIGEDSIISNILSMDFDPWDESLTSPRNLAKFLGKSDNKQPRKAQNSNQSRFSFARQEDDDHGDKNSNNNSIYDGNGFSSFTYGESATNHFPMSQNNKISVSRAQVSAPPGFSGPSRPPPPGFTSHERMDQTFDNLSEVFGQQASYFLGNHVRKSVEESQVNDFEFMDPAILAVGGRVNNNNNIRSNFPSQLNSFESDMRLQLLMQRSFSQQNLNPRFTEVGVNMNNYPQHQTDSYSRMMMMENGLSLSSHHHHHHQQPRSSIMSNSHWNSWNGIESGNGNGNERLGFGSRYYSGHEDAKFQIPTRGDLYNRTFGI